MSSPFQISSLFSDHAVLQRDQELSIWGRDRAGQGVSIRLGNHVGETRADAEGRWSLLIPPHEAGGPYELEIIGSEQRNIHDVQFGDVWLCGGQSNMDFPLEKSTAAEIELAAAQDLELRFFRVPKRVSGSPEEVFPEECVWEVCSPSSAREFSAVAYHFGTTLRRDVGVLIGLIQASWGGTPIEAWSDPATLPQELSDTERLLANQADDIQRWEANRDAALEDLRGLPNGWAESAFDDSDWIPCAVPGNFEEAAGDLDGAVWYRREVDIPAAWAGVELELHLGVIDDLDHTFWNGELIGRMGIETPEYYQCPRIYRIPALKVSGGNQSLAVRVFDEFLAGGFVSQEDEIWIAPVGADPSERISLTGWWRVRMEQCITPRMMLPGMPQMLPGVLFHGMISPLTRFAMRGVIWYQGENNVGSAGAYRDLLSTLIHNWRSHWNSQLAFLVVQLANFGLPRSNPSGSALADLRDAQSLAFDLPDAGMVTAIDLGDADDIHPRNKRDVGLRLAWLALVKIYHQGDAGKLSPRAVKARTVPDGIRVEFQYPGTLRTADSEDPKSFELQAHDGIRHPAEARIDGDQLCILVPPGLAVREVRHGWADNPVVNVVNAGGLPLFPFRLLVES